MRTHIRRNAGKFMHRQKYHKLLNKQLIFETISNTWKTEPNRTENNKNKKKNQINKTTTTNKPTFWRWCLSASVRGWVFVRSFFFFAVQLYPMLVRTFSFQSVHKTIETAKICWEDTNKRATNENKRSSVDQMRNMLQIITNEQKPHCYFFPPLLEIPMCDAQLCNRRFTIF